MTSARRTLAVGLFGSVLLIQEAKAQTATIIRSTQKVLPTDSPLAAQSIEISAAQNEFEAFQLVVIGGTRGLSSVSVTKPVFSRDGASDSVDASATRLYREGTVLLTQPSSNEGAVGASRSSPIAYPDPLIPGTETVAAASFAGGWTETVTSEPRSGLPFDVPRNGNVVVFADVHVPDGTVPGHYTGSTTVSAKYSDNTSQVFQTSFTIGLTVRSFRLESTTSLPTMFGFAVDAACRAHGAADGQGHCPDMPSQHFWSRLYARFMLDHRVTITLPDDLINKTDGTPDFPATETRFNSDYKPFIDGNDSKPRQLSGARMTTVSYPWFRASDAAQTSTDKAREWAGFSSNGGWLARMFDYSGDEPQQGANSTWDSTYARATLIHNAYPSFRTATTAGLTDYTREATNRGGDFINIIIPVWDQLDDATNGNRMSAYASFAARPNNAWWGYQSCDQHGCASNQNGTVNWTNMMVDATGVQNRSEPWMHFIYGSEGALYYNAAYLLDRAWIQGGVNGDPGIWNATGNGDGTLLYPGTPSQIGGTTHVPVASYRLKMVREGLEDYEYLTKCKSVDSNVAINIALFMFPMQGLINGQPTGSVYGANDFGHSPRRNYVEAVEQARGELADCIESGTSARTDIVGTNDQIYHRGRYGGIWRNWEPVGTPPVGTTGDPAIASWTYGRLDVFARGGDGAVWHAWRSGDDQPWSWQNLGGSMAGSPAAASWGSDRVDVVVKDSGNVNFWHYWWDHFPPWGNDYLGHPPPGIAPDSDAAMTSWGPNRLDIFVRGGDGAIWHKYWNGSAWRPSQGDWQSDASSGLGPQSGVVFFGSPAVSSWGAGRLDLFILGQQSFTGAIHVWHKWYEDAAQHWYPDGGWEDRSAPAIGIGGNLGVSDSAFNRVGVFVRGADGTVWKQFWNGTQWSAWGRIEPLVFEYVASGVDAASPPR